MSNIYKIAHIRKKDEIDTIYVFIGNIETHNYNDLFIYIYLYRCLIFINFI